MSQYDNVDERILLEIDEVRLEMGCCSAGLLANKMRMARGTIVDRCIALRAAGLVEWNDAHGSLRRVREREDRLYELTLIRAVECGDEDDRITVFGDTVEVNTWRSEVMAMATAAAWPELVPQDGEDEPGPTQVREAVSPEIACVPCDRTFATPQALAGHRRSKQHAASVAGV